MADYDTSEPCPRDECGGRIRRVLGAADYYGYWIWYACPECGYDDLDPEVEAALDPWIQPVDADEIGAL